MAIKNITCRSYARENDDVFLAALKSIDGVDLNGLDHDLVHRVVLRQLTVDLSAQLVQLLLVRTEHADLIFELCNGTLLLYLVTTCIAALTSMFGYSSMSFSINLAMN
jgi:hypothetical protein